jgi:hypothetical protein
MAPRIDIDTTTAFVAKGTLGTAHQCAYTLAHRGDQMNARRKGGIGPGMP